MPKGRSTEDHILGEVGAVLDGTAPGRQSADDITFYQSLGFAAEDLATASFVLDRAKKQNVGVTVEFQAALNVVTPDLIRVHFLKRYVDPGSHCAWPG